MGESVSEGSIVEWRKKVGDWVDDGETLVDITTDKVDVEVPSTASGVITALHGDEGATIPVGTVLVEIDTTAAKPEGAAAAGAATAAGDGTAHGASAAAPAPNVTLSSSKGAPQDPTLVTPASYGAAGSGAAPAERHAGNGKAGGVLSHHARRLVERLHIDASKLTGTGPDGLILREDVEAAVASGKIAFSGGIGSASAAPAPGGSGDRRDLPAGPGGREGHRPQGLRRDARVVHGTVAVDPGRDVVPHAARRHARTAPRGAERRAQTSRPHREDLVHARHRVRAGPRRARAAGDHGVVPPRRRQTAARRSGREPRPRRGRAEKRRLALPGRAGAEERRRARLRAVPRRVRRPRREGARQQAVGGRTNRRDVHADEPRRHRHRRVGAAPDGGPRRDHRRGRDRVPAGLRARVAHDARADRRRESDDADVDVRPPRHPRRAVGRISQARRRAARRRRRVLRDGVRAARRERERPRRRARRARTAPRRRLRAISAKRRKR